MDLVDLIHQQNSHAGWDATWATLSSSYYGVLRSDLIFLLKRCQICAQSPPKRSKGSVTPTVSSQAVEGQPDEFVDTRESRLNNLERTPTDNDAERECGISEDIPEESILEQNSSGFGYDHCDWLEGDTQQTAYMLRLNGYGIQGLVTKTLWVFSFVSPPISSLWFMRTLVESMS